MSATPSTPQLSMHQQHSDPSGPSNNAQEEEDQQKIGWLTNQTAQFLALLGSAGYVISSFANDDWTEAFFNKLGAVLCFVAVFICIVGQQGVWKWILRQRHSLAMMSVVSGGALIYLSMIYKDQLKIVWADRTLSQICRLFAASLYTVGFFLNGDVYSLNKFYLRYMQGRQEQVVTVINWLHIATAVLYPAPPFVVFLADVFFVPLDRPGFFTALLVYAAALVIVLFLRIYLEWNKTDLETQKLLAQINHQLVTLTEEQQLNYYKHSETMRNKVRTIRQQYPNVETRLSGLSQTQLYYLVSILQLPIPDSYTGEERVFITQATETLNTMTSYELLDIWAGLRQEATSSVEQWYAATEYTDDETGRIAQWMEQKLTDLFPNN